MYRERIWTCKITGRANLTYEEGMLLHMRNSTFPFVSYPYSHVSALLSEKKASAMTEQFPETYVKPFLQLIQGSK